MTSSFKSEDCMLLRGTPQSICWPSTALETKSISIGPCYARSVGAQPRHSTAKSAKLTANASDTSEACAKPLMDKNA